MCVNDLVWESGWVCVRERGRVRVVSRSVKVCCVRTRWDGVAERVSDSKRESERAREGGSEGGRERGRRGSSNAALTWQPHNATIPWPSLLMLPRCYGDGATPLCTDASRVGWDSTPSSHLPARCCFCFTFVRVRTRSIPFCAAILGILRWLGALLIRHGGRRAVRSFPTVRTQLCTIRELWSFRMACTVRAPGPFYCLDFYDRVSQCV